MIEHRCKNCIWWDDRHPSVTHIPHELHKTQLGFCRRRKAAALRIGQFFYGVHPLMDADEFCGEFRGNK